MRKGNSGKQQLDARATLPSAAKLAAIVLVEPGRVLVSSGLLIDLIQHYDFAFRLPVTTGQHAELPCVSSSRSHAA